MRQQFIMYCHPWDLVDEGIDEAVSRLAGEIGLDAICVSAVLPEVTRLRARGTGAGRVFRSPAGVHFQPQAACYTRGRLRPTPAAWMKSRNPLETIIGAAQKHRLKAHVFIQPLEGETLVARYPHAARLNVFGDCASVGLCPGNPEVREYLIGLVEDLSSNYAIEAIEIVELPSDPRKIAPADAYRLLNKADAATLAAFFDLCFCAACRQRAAESGIEMARVEDAARRRVLRSLGMVDDDVTENASASADCDTLETYRQTHVETVISLMKSLQELSRSSLWRRVPAVGGAAVESLPQADTYVVETPCGATMPEAARRLLSRGVPVALAQDLPSAWPCDASVVVAATHDAAREGYTSIGFSSYGEIPSSLLAGVRQAIRYARREA